MGAPLQDWPHANMTFLPPDGRDDVIPVNVFRNRGFLVMPVQLSPEELAEVNASGGVVFLSIMGSGMPPVFVGSESATKDVIAECGLWR
ncbi:MAG: hypothetical protein C0421_05865 [Hyphomonas sp.]|uniref:hypothetical protein n=1 Tax=Hyphomonas sp. TaxID=87 RepID=UPI0025BCD27D|nr:hypothetical protein [Hyphomonas sp.]MBA4338353.1 hypothetical protein [Hyphomonas sp.]